MTTSGSLQATIDQLVTLVEQARSMPMSASCVINRQEALDLLEQLRAAVPAELTRARTVLADRDAVVADGRRQAEQLLAEAARERSRMLTKQALVAEAQAEADRIVEQARLTGEATRAEVDDYVDSKLANFEVVLTTTLSAVERGREKLAGRLAHDALRDLSERPDSIAPH